MKKFSFIYEGRVYNFKEQHLKNIVYSETKKLVSEAYKPKFEALDKRYGNLLNESKYRIVYNLKREKLQEAFGDTVKKYAGKAWDWLKSTFSGQGAVSGQGIKDATDYVTGLVGSIVRIPFKLTHDIVAGALNGIGFGGDKNKEQQVTTLVTNYQKEVGDAKTPEDLAKFKKELVDQVTKIVGDVAKGKKAAEDISKKLDTEANKNLKKRTTSAGISNLSGNLEAALKSPEMAKYKLEDTEKNWIAANVLEPMKKAPSAQKVFLLEAEAAAIEPSPTPAAAPKAAPVAKPTLAAPTAKSSTKPATRLSVELSKKLIADTTLQPLQKTKIKNFLSAWVKTQKGTVEDRFSRALFDAGIGVKVKTSQNDYEIDSEEPINTATAPAVSAGEAPAASTTAKPPPPPPADADETEEPATAGTEPAPATTASTPDAKVGEAIKGVKKQYNKATDENTRQVIDQVADAVQKALAGKFNAEAGQVVNLTEEQVDVQISGIIMDVLNKSNLNNSAKQALYKQIYITLKNNRNIGYQTSGLRHNYATRNARPAATDTAKAPTAPAAVKTQAVKPNPVRSQLEESKQLYTKKGNMFVLNG